MTSPHRSRRPGGSGRFRSAASRTTSKAAPAWRSSWRRGTRPPWPTVRSGCGCPSGLPAQRSSPVRAIRVPAPAEGGYLRIERDFKAGDKLTVDFQNTLVLEGRRFRKVPVAPGQVSRVKDVAVLAGPDLLFATPVKSGGRPVLLATLDAGGRLSFPASGDGQLVTVALPGIEASDAQIAQAVQSARPVFLRTWPGIVASRHDEPAFISVVAMSDMGKWQQHEAAASALHVRSGRRACGLAGRGPCQAGRPRQGNGERAGGADLRREPGKTARNLAEPSGLEVHAPGTARLRWRHRPDRRRGLWRLSLRVRVDRPQGRPRDRRLGRPGTRTRATA